MTLNSNELACDNRIANNYELLQFMAVRRYLSLSRGRVIGRRGVGASA